MKVHRADADTFFRYPWLGARYLVLGVAMLGLRAPTGCYIRAGTLLAHSGGASVQRRCLFKKGSEVRAWDKPL